LSGDGGLLGGLLLSGGGSLSGSSLGGGSLGGSSLSGGLNGSLDFFLGGSLGMSSFLSVGNFFLVFSSLLLSVFFEDLVVVSLGLSGSFPSGLLVSLRNDCENS